MAKCEIPKCDNDGEYQVTAQCPTPDCKGFVETLRCADHVIKPITEIYKSDEPRDCELCWEKTPWKDWRFRWHNLKNGWSDGIGGYKHGEPV